MVLKYALQLFAKEKLKTNFFSFILVVYDSDNEPEELPGECFFFSIWFQFHSRNTIGFN